MIDDYFGFLITIAKKNPLVKKFRLIKEFTGVKKVSTSNLRVI